MPVPVSSSHFLAVIRQSRLVDPRVLAEFLQQRGAPLPDNPAKAATILVLAGILTRFQASHLLQGKWRGFFIGRYRVLEKLGTGGMGTVYLCEHVHMKRKAAIKVLPVSLAANPSFRERFYREAKAVAALNHPNIVRAFDVGEDQSQNLHYLAMEYFEGSSLHVMVTKNGPLGVLQAIRYMIQVTAGLQHAFEVGLVHRDIKPGNILIDLTGSVKILDLGLARFSFDEQDDLSIRHDEKVIGTADYLSPEQAISSRLADVRSDIYSLGCTFYFCLTGRPPFPAGTAARKIILHQQAKPWPIKALRDEVPLELIAILDKMMAKRPGDRYQTPAELAQALANLPVMSGDTSSSTAGLTLKQNGGSPETGVWTKPIKATTLIVKRVYHRLKTHLQKKRSDEELSL